MFSKMKQNSRLAMAGSWGGAAGIIFMLMALEGIISVFTTFATYAVNGGVFFPPNPTMEYLRMMPIQFYLQFGVQLVRVVFAVFLLAPLWLGIYSWYMAIVKGEPERFTAVFIFFENSKRYWRAVWYSISMSLRFTLWAVLFFLLPFAIMGGTIGLSQRFSASGNSQLAIFSAMGMILAVLLTALALLLYIAYMNKYFLVAYLLATDPAISVGAAVKKSVQLTRGHRFPLLWSALSFIGWFIVTLVFFPILFYTVPYARASFAMYAQYLIEDAHRNETAKNEELTREFSAEAHENAIIAPSDTHVQSEAFTEAPPENPANEDAPPQIQQPNPAVNSAECYNPAGNPRQQDPAKNGHWPYL